jgi:hypothetical protein
MNNQIRGALYKEGFASPLAVFLNFQTYRKEGSKEKQGRSVSDTRMGGLGGKIKEKQIR